MQLYLLMRFDSTLYCKAYTYIHISFLLFSLGCPSGTYGQDCASTCMCENGGTCLENGFCACPTGWDGHDCSYKGTFLSSCVNC